MVINWKNTAENLGLVLAGVIFGAIMEHRISMSTTKTLLEQQKSLIERAIDKESIKNEITNKILFENNKFKKSDSIIININQIPDNKQEPINIIKKTKEPEKKRTWFGRTFFKKK